MALTPGTRLGFYDITAPIGEGGMGQVYRATDTTLDREVAIKFPTRIIGGGTPMITRPQYAVARTLRRITLLMNWNPAAKK